MTGNQGVGFGEFRGDAVQASSDRLAKQRGVRTAMHIGRIHDAQIITRHKIRKKFAWAIEFQLMRRLVSVLVLSTITVMPAFSQEKFVPPNVDTRSLELPGEDRSE